MKNKKIIIISSIINIVLIGLICSFININKDIIREKQIVKEMSENNQVTDLNNQINSLNTEHTEYMNYIQTCKTQLASTISNEGVPTSEDDTFEKMVTNIGDIFTQRTKLDESVAATADNISEGKQAYVNGELITGTGNDNQSYYNRGLNESVVIYDLGIGRSFNVSSIEGYESFTTDNFITTHEVSGQSPWWNVQNDTVTVLGVTGYEKSYKASTGVLTAYGKIQGKTQIGGVYYYGNVNIINVHAYLITDLSKLKTIN